jgi:hypothetical protein
MVIAPRARGKPEGTTNGAPLVPWGERAQMPEVWEAAARSV